jgi:hypothetical protein
MIRFLRKFATPVSMGAFTLSAVTGLLMFFEAGVGMNHLAHEWLGWALVLGVLTHVATNWAAFKNYFVNKRATTLPIVAMFLVLLAGSFAPPPGQPEGPSPARMALNALVASPLTAVAPVAKRSPDDLVAALKAGGFSKASSPDQSVLDIVGGDREDQGKAFEVIFKK